MHLALSLLLSTCLATAPDSLSAGAMPDSVPKAVVAPQTPSSSSSRLFRDSTAGGIAPMFLGGTSAALTILPALKPSDNMMGGPNLLISTGVFAGGALAGYAAHRASQAGLPEPSSQFLLQDQTAGWSLFLAGVVAGSSARPSIPFAAAAGWGLLATDLATQRQVREHWAQDSARLAFLARLQIGATFASVYAGYDGSLEPDPDPNTAGIALLALWPVSYGMASIFRQDDADLARRRGATSAALVVLASPVAAWGASTATNGSPDATVLAIAGTGTLGLLASPILPPLPGSAQSHRFALLGAMLGSGYGLAKQREALQKKKTSSNDAPVYRKARIEMWKTTIFSSLVGAASGWGLGQLAPSNSSVAFEPTLPSPVVGQDGRLAMGLGGVIVHFR